MKPCLLFYDGLKTFVPFGRTRPSFPRKNVGSGGMGVNWI